MRRSKPLAREQQWRKKSTTTHHKLEIRCLRIYRTSHINACRPRIIMTYNKMYSVDYKFGTLKGNIMSVVVCPIMHVPWARVGKHPYILMMEFVPFFD